MMKKHIVCILLLCAVFPLRAQSNNSASIYVLPVTGTGSRAGDNEFFYNKLNSEVTYQKFNLAKAMNNAEFYLIGTISLRPPEDADEPPGVKQYVFHLTLLDTKTNMARADGELVYENPETVNDQFSTLVYSLLYTIPEDAGKDNWRNKRLYVGAGAFWTPRVYTAEGTSAHLTSFGGGISAEYHFLNFLSVGVGFELASDAIKVIAKSKKDYGNTLLEIPVMVKGVFKPNDIFILEPYAGIHFNIPFEETTTPPPISWLAGFQYGVKAGPGVVFIDPRFSMDIGETGMEADPIVKGLTFQRYIIHVGVGYKLGFFTKR
jgi:hypothetical protein